MTISLDKIGKRFNREWIFRNLDLQIDQGQSLAITGPNGSGKSTLLQIICGNLLPSEGEISFKDNGKKVDDNEVFSLLTIAAPYLEIIEEFTLKEFLRFHFGFKPLVSGVDLKDLPELFQLGHAVDKPIKNFSTGMRQRVKLGICFYCDLPLILLDEPTSNLDIKGIDWYLSQIEMIKDQRTLIISSNNEKEYDFCQTRIDIMDFKRPVVSSGK